MRIISLAGVKAAKINKFIKVLGHFNSNAADVKVAHRYKFDPRINPDTGVIAGWVCRHCGKTYQTIGWVKRHKH